MFALHHLNFKRFGTSKVLNEDCFGGSRPRWRALDWCVDPLPSSFLRHLLLVWKGGDEQLQLACQRMSSFHFTSTVYLHSDSLPLSAAQHFYGVYVHRLSVCHLSPFSCCYSTLRWRWGAGLQTHPVSLSPLRCSPCSAHSVLAVLPLSRSLALFLSSCILLLNSVYPAVSLGTTSQSKKCVLFFLRRPL